MSIADYVRQIDTKFLNRQLDIFYVFVNAFGSNLLTDKGKDYFNLLKGERATRIDSEVKPIILWLRAKPQEGHAIGTGPFAILLARETDTDWCGVEVERRNQPVSSYSKSLFEVWS